MNYRTFAPPPHLARYVRTFWVYEGDASESEPYVYRGYADGCVEMVFHYRGPFDDLDGDVSTASLAAAICGPASSPTRFVVREKWAIFGCYIYPFAVPALLGIPTSEISNTKIEPADALGIEGRDLQEKMLSARNNSERLRLITRFLVSRIDESERRELLLEHCVRGMIGCSGSFDLTRLRREYQLSQRQFQRQFKSMTGFAAQKYARIMRFQSALKFYGTDRSLTDIAYELGYYDQSHFISDFREFSGYNPKIYFAGNAEGSEYLDT